jgi:hypothetical protein
MADIIKPDEIDLNIGINEVDTEVAVSFGWADDAGRLAEKASTAGTDLVYVTDAEGAFICLATREMAEWLMSKVNDPSPSII